ncbi:hypothetical protein [Streptomyces sp. TS71-3]|uniref:hypothetical protein n=1 Tax=Streptomyces sp. TS71-3 TaxID=2733862 RepID=UPI001B2A6577|nr:hypothetical protein [Streptomyces sp. TS71-3]GHJ40144.1 hypothetical protein Sm713_57530 [Streptomyces sp. TS71-3]
MVNVGMRAGTFAVTGSGRRSAGLALACLAALGIAVSAAAPAGAANGRPGVRETVCADSLSVRTAPGGAWMGELRKPQTFDVEKVQSGWAYGFAYGDINRKGWVQDGWFC